MKWKKIGQIFDPTTWNDGIERTWMKTHSQCTHSLVLEDTVRIYFSCRPENDNEGYAKSYTSFLELDRNDLTMLEWLIHLQQELMDATLYIEKLKSKTKFHPH